MKCQMWCILHAECFSSLYQFYACIYWFVAGEAVNSSSGLGFNGYDQLGRAKWDLIDNADIFHVEVKWNCMIILNDCSVVM